MDEEKYKQLWQVPFYHKPDMITYLDKVLGNFYQENIPPPDYLETKKILENRYGSQVFEENKNRVRSMLWRDHRVTEIQNERARLNLAPITVFGGRKKRHKSKRKKQRDRENKEHPEKRERERNRNIKTDRNIKQKKNKKNTEQQN